MPTDAAPTPPARDDARRVVRMDMHVHSNASDGPAVAALGFIGCPECYSEPESVYVQAMSRGMDLVTLTDHDSIAGAIHLLDRGFDRLVIGEEVTVHFPEDRCRLHVLVWGLTPELHEELATLKLRDDVYAFAAWLRQHSLAHSLAHPLYVQNGRLTRWHLERCVLLFRAFEVLNGAHSGTHRDGIDAFLGWLSPATVNQLVTVHGIEPVWPRAWEKAATAGSDDHGLLNIGRTWTAVPRDFEDRSEEPEEFLRRVMSGRGRAGGQAGHSSLLAHQLASVGAQYLARRVVPKLRPRARFAASRVLRCAGVHVPEPSTISLVLDKARSVLTRRRIPRLPLGRALLQAARPVLERHDALRAACTLDGPMHGGPLSEHESMAAFFDELFEAVNGALGAHAVTAMKDKSRIGVADAIMSYAMVHAAQLPYLFSLFHQNKERPMIERMVHDCAPAGSGLGPLERPMRVSLFTDTLGDVNGVSRFIQNAADMAERTGRDLRVITSTRFDVPDRPNIINFAPMFATRMPKYEQLEIALPPLLPILRHIDQHQPDVIHISTPGPVGAIGFIAARMLRVPVLGVYHTDFPAYVDHLFDDHALTWMTSTAMRLFYQPFKSIFTRSDDYVRSLAALGLDRDRIVTLSAGVDIDTFHRRARDTSCWTALGARTDSVKVLYVGRISVEKNLPMLTPVWKEARRQIVAAGVDAELILVGDGPYRQQMQRELQGENAVFLGFRHGDELSRLYASSDFFVFPSVTDTLGQVVMESQASGIPVIVTDKGGPKEVVTEGKTGHVVNSDDPRGWARAIASLAIDHDRRRVMGDAAFEAMQSKSIASSFEHFWEVHERAWHDHLATRGIINAKGHSPAAERATPSVASVQ